MELRDLEYFLACVETGSVTRAAERVHAAQPTISHALSRLERELGERLLDRSPRTPLRATDAGELLAVHARQALGALAGFREALSELRGELVGSLRVAAVPSLCVTLLPRVLSALAKTHPRINIQVRALAAEKIARAVASAREDLGLVAGAPGVTLTGVAATELYNERFALVVRRDHPLSCRKSVTMKALHAYPLLLPPPGTFTSNIIHEACRRAGFEPTIRLTLASAEALREATRAGLGPTILPQDYLRARDPDLLSVNLQSPTPVRAVFLVERKEANVSAPRAARTFVTALRQLTKRS